MSTRPVRRPDILAHDARQSAAPLAHFIRLRADEPLRRIVLTNTRLADVTCGTIRLKLLKIGALVKISFGLFAALMYLV